MDIEGFLRRWTSGEGGAERANYTMFLSELCDLLEVARPEPACGGVKLGAYQFEGPVRTRESDATQSVRRIDLYKRDCFILEAKQSGQKARHPEQGELPFEPGVQGRRGASKTWDALLMRARSQAEGYVFLLPPQHAAPPFLIVCDVGHSFDLYADFTGTGRNYTQFPDRRGYRIYLEELRDPAIRARLKSVWEDPASLDPSRERARVTQAIARRLAEVSKELEKRKYPAQEVAQFLMRSVFTMFAEDVGLLPADSFKGLLQKCAATPDIFVPMMAELWAKMDTGGFYSGLGEHLRRFNGGLFKDARALPLGREEIGELIAAAHADWRQVEPAIFGTLLEQALDVAERSRLGAHFTPRAYVDRLVNVTVMEPLREEWRAARMAIEDAKAHEDVRGAVAAAQAFHRRLCDLKVLDPACGTGNFLYAALELIKRLESEVLELLLDLGETESIGFETVDPHQFLGIEVNPRAAAIAELVVWIGYLQWHYRTRSAHPNDPILRDFHNVTCKDAVLDWDGYPDRSQGFKGTRLPDWPEADFIVGNPPFIGGKDVREELGGDYVEALWAAHRTMNDSADLVMYWWDRAADILTRKKTRLIRFGFVTTNSITQVFQRKTVERWLNAKKPASLIYAIADHPWTKATKDAAAVRISMTVAKSGGHEGTVERVTKEEGLNTDAPHIVYAMERGRINADLTIGVDVTQAKGLKANDGLSSRGVVLHGAGFIVTPQQAAYLGLGRVPEAEKIIRPYRNGRDLMGRGRNVMVIDLFGLTADDIREKYGAIYQHVLAQVKPERDHNKRDYRRLNWWLFGENVPEFRRALEGLPRYIATVETAKHRVFQFLDGAILPDNKLVNFALSDGFGLGVLHSKPHFIWYVANSAKIGMYEGDAVYVKSRCFDPFPFPEADLAQRQVIGDIAEALDAHRKRVLSDHPHLTLTGVYNVLERLRAGVAPDALTPDERRIFDDGLVLILKEYHDRLDTAVLAAYGWAAEISDEEMLGRLVALNQQRAAEEAAGQVRWLRPDYQIPRFARAAKARTGELELEAVSAQILRPDFPKSRDAQPFAVLRAVERAGLLSEEEVVRAFANGGRYRQRILTLLRTLDDYGHLDRLPDGRVLTHRVA
ncbi:MAG: class I SAM-dependent DNA methyltransferase [Asticcacaulis sp.]